MAPEINSMSLATLHNRIDLTDDTILEFNDNEVKVDLNHPLAGQTAQSCVKIIEVINLKENRALG